MATVVAVVCSYWSSRINNVKRIVKDLREGTRVPDRILVLNNNKKHTLEIEGAEIINSEFNSRSRGKFLVALLHVADYYLLLDDDCTVSSRTLERYMESAHRKSCHASFGQKLGVRGRQRPMDVKEETEVDWFLGTGIFTSFYCIIRMLVAEENLRVRGKWKHEGEDVLLGLANYATILPMVEDEDFIRLEWGKEAMAWGSDGVTKGGKHYLHMRRQFTKDAVKSIEEHPIPDF